MDFRLFFNKMRSDTHCINSLLPCSKSTVYGLRDKERHYELPTRLGSLVSFEIFCYAMSV